MEIDDWRVRDRQFRWFTWRFRQFQEWGLVFARTQMEEAPARRP
ncbi:hypothetical protein RHA1_ro00607 [Rhodococcus jostii RHA1]|uniref:Uncharacterized protein n=1 Tax=Rhodococcus jostii (strain RHA1) TaxID=101510 RepID=Q0SJ44_RHOJR|nr:hypothetical protein RHA1_ro00607 [Rhodococcus jostii RHA1]EJJ01508.1 hypothetical protein JVH1_0981 [Rhodococcus sp. JVH1]